MDLIYAVDPDYALLRGLKHITSEGEVEESRNGRVLVAPCPVVTLWQRPQQRVLFNDVRDANPFFHMMEALWMLAGRRDVQTMAEYVGRMKDYSDDGVFYHGAYGYRWRYWFGHDQLDEIVTQLRMNPRSRRIVLSMWSASDLITESKDLPCNTHCYFRLRGDFLDMTVLNRSNDIVWGAYGSNVVHFSFLMEYVANSIGAMMGKMYQFSNNFHFYLDRGDSSRYVVEDGGVYSIAPSFLKAVNHPYQQSTITPFRPFVKIKDRFDKELQAFFNGNDKDLSEPFLLYVARPMRIAHELYRQKKLDDAVKASEEIMSEDWKLACLNWLDRRTP